MTDWLRHEFEVSGRPAEVAAFREAAAGCNIVPWQLDLAAGEETWFLLAMRGAPQLGAPGARALAAQLRAAADARHGTLAAWIGRNRACLLDLHALVPVPPDILRRGPDDPASRAWLWANWGTTEVLRHVRELPARPGRGSPKNPSDFWGRPRRRGLARFRLEFYAADWTPWRAILAMRARWPALRFTVWPDYASGAP